MKAQPVLRLLAASLGGIAFMAQAADWPEPPVIDPGPPGGIPSDAIVLFDGKDLSAWRNAQGEPARWEIKDGVAIVNGTGNIFTKQEFGACQVHIEWAAPKPNANDGQGRGNSGAYLQGRYEIQILDSYQNKTYPDGQAGAFYENFPPLVNACRPPTEWQTYDIIFHPPLPGADGQIVPGSFTVLHNGVLIQDHVPVKTSTRASAFSGPVERGPLMLQDHGNPARYKRIWIRPLK